ncbi:MAG: DinB family protein [Geodermatophilaceae bacterium]|nr:DinB family protein [Geodermatophilaceae bacterium]MDQ3457268.1 DinB family protein [Actinomycetota bacterium]
MTSPGLFATDRQEPLYAGGEQEQLESWLDYHRDTLLRKCEGLTPEQLRSRSCEPSTLTLLGLVRHMAEVESWFNDDPADGAVPPIHYSQDNPDGDFHDVADADIEADEATFRRCVERSRAFTAEHRDLGAVLAHRRSGEAIPLRWIYLHMIEEYARHNGHADLLRERIDGATGD